jgi:TolB-like protein
MKRTNIGILVLALLSGAPCMPAQDKDIKALAANLADTLAKLSKKTVAVVDFNDLQGNVTELGRYLAEQVSVALAMTDKGIEVIDRTHLKVLLQENKLSSSGIIDPATARKLGQIAGVEVLVTGTLTPFGDSVQLAVKALDATTAHIVGAATTDIAKTKAIEELLSRGIATATAPSAQPSAAPPSAYSGEVKRIRDLEVNFKGCRVVATGVLCEALVTNLGEQRQYCLYSKDGDTMSRIVDAGGNVSTPRGIRLADHNSSDRVIECANLPSGVPVRSGMLFPDARVEGGRLTLVEFLFDLERSYAGRTSLSAQFRGVPVTSGAPGSLDESPAQSRKKK